MPKPSFKLAFCPMGHACTVVRMLMGFYIDEITFGISFVLKLSSRCPVSKPALTCYHGLKYSKMIIIAYSYILKENYMKFLSYSNMKNVKEFTVKTQ